MESTTPRPPRRVVRPSEIDFEKMLQLFTHRHTKSLFTRQAAALLKIIRTCKDGLRLPYLAPIRKIVGFVVEAIVSKSVDSDVFLEPLCQLIVMHGQPFDLERDYDEMDNAESISASVQALGDAMKTDNPVITITVADTLARFINLIKPTHFPTPGSSPSSPNGAKGPASPKAASPKASPKDDSSVDIASFLSCPPAVLRYHVVAHSGLIPTLLATLEAHYSEVDVALSLTKLIRDLSYNAVCAQDLADGGFFKLVPLLLNSDCRNPVVDATLEIIWNLLDLVPSALDIVGTEQNVAALGAVLEQLLLQCSRAQDKELRNQVLVILVLIAKRPAHRKHLARTDCLRMILRHAVHTELGQQNDGVMDWTQTTEGLDLEMKLLMWSIITCCCEERFGYSQAVQANFLAVLFMYLEPDSYQFEPVLTRWPFTQLLQLQRHALHSVIKIAATMPSQLAEQRGVEQLVRFAVTIADNPENLVEKQLARQQTLKLQGLALQALVRILSSTSAELDPSPQLMAALIGLCGANIELTTSALAMSIISLLTTSSDAARKLFRKMGGLRTICDTLADLPRVSMLAKQCPMLLGAVVDCIWSVLNNTRNKIFFISMDGVDHLLNLLLILPAGMAKQVLGSVADLVQNEKAHQFLHQWRCPASLNNSCEVDKPNSGRPRAAHILSVFVALWKREVVRLEEAGVDTDENDIRGSICSVLSRVGFDTFSYAIPEEASILKEIESFPASQKNRAFVGLVSELASEGVQPVGDDATYLQLMMDQCAHVQREAKAFQTAELNKVAEDNAAVLNAYYQKIRDHSNQGPGPTQSKSTGLSMRKRMAAKEMKEDMLLKSLDVEATMRRTTIFNDEDIEAMPMCEEDDLQKTLQLQGLVAAV